MAFNPNFSQANVGNQYVLPPRPPQSLLRPADVTSQIASRQGPGPDRFAPRRGGFRNSREGQATRAGSREIGYRNASIEPGFGFDPRELAVNSRAGPSSHGDRQSMARGRAPSPSSTSSGYNNAEVPNGTIPYANHTERRDPVTHQKLIGERIQRERPCRTLFVRNVSYEADTQAVLRSFEAFGDIKGNFDLVRNRGMLFVTYYDFRAAESAKDAMHSTLVMNRPIDVHYSLPRADETSGICDREKNQGTLLISLTNGREANPVQVRRAFERFGLIKDLRPGSSPGTARVEFYDSRSAVSAYDTLQDTPLDSSHLRLQFDWDQGEDSKSGLAPLAHAIPEERRIGGGLPGGQTQQGLYNRPAPYPDRPNPPTSAQTNKSEDRLQDARKIQDLLAGLGALPPPATGYAFQPAPVTPASTTIPGPAQHRGAPSQGPPPPYGRTPDAGYARHASQIPPGPPIPRMIDTQTNFRGPAPNVLSGVPVPTIPPNVFAAVQRFNASGPGPGPVRPPYSAPPPAMTRPSFPSPNGAPIPTQQTGPSTTASNNNGDTTQAMTQLLALLVAQQQK